MIKRAILCLLLCLVALSFAQNGHSHWQRTETPLVRANLFHSLHVINLPTASTLQKNDIEFEISHRFIPPVTEGTGALWGIDGPVNMRLGLTFGITNDLQIAVGRSNVEDNSDLQLRYQFARIEQLPIPVHLAIDAGIAYNSQLTADVKSNDRKYQYFARMIANTMIQKKVGFGMAPSYLYNSHIYCPNIQESWLLPVYVQYYVSSSWSLQAEWAPTLSGWRRWHDSFALGFEIETGGHFFKIFMTNNAVINPAQYLAGADLDPKSRDWRLGFMITRLLDVF